MNLGNLLTLILLSCLKYLLATWVNRRDHCYLSVLNRTNFDFNSHMIPFKSPLYFQYPIRTAHLFIPCPSDSFSTSSLYNIGSSISSYFAFPLDRVWISAAPSSLTELPPQISSQQVPSGTPGRLVLLRPDSLTSDPVSEYVGEVFEDEGVRLLQVTLLVGCTDQHLAWLPHASEQLSAASIAETEAQLELLSRIERAVESGSLSSAIGLPVHPDWFVIVRLRPQSSQILRSNLAQFTNLRLEPASESDASLYAPHSQVQLDPSQPDPHPRRLRRSVQSEQQAEFVGVTRVKRVDEMVDNENDSDYLISEVEALDVEGSGSMPPDARISIPPTPTLRPPPSGTPNIAPQLLQPLWELVAFLDEELVYDLPARMFVDPDTDTGIAALRLELRCEWPCGEKWPHSNMMVSSDLLRVTVALSVGAGGGGGGGGGSIRLRGLFASEPYLRAALAADASFARWRFTLSAFDSHNASATDRFVVQLRERLVVAPPTHPPLTLTTLSESAELEKENTPPVYRKGTINELFRLYIGMVFEYHIPWDAFRDAESGALADGRLMLHLTTTDGSTPPPWLWLIGPNVDLPFSASTELQQSQQQMPRVDLVVRGSRAVASASASDAHSARAPFLPARARTRVGGVRGVARSGQSPRQGPGPGPGNATRPVWDASSKRRQPQPQRSRFGYSARPSPYVLVALPLDKALTRAPARYQLKLTVLDPKFMSVSVMLNISVQEAPFSALLNHRLVFELDVVHPKIFANDFQTLVKLIKSVATMHSNSDASRLLLSDLYGCDPSAASPPTPRAERGVGGTSFGTSLSLGGGGDDSILRAAGLCIGLSNVTYLLGTPTSASSERGKRSVATAASAVERIANKKKLKRADPLCGSSRESLVALLAPLLDPLHPGLIRAGALDTLAGVTSRIRSVTLQPLSHCTRVIESVRLFSSPEAASAAQRDLMDPNTQAFYKAIIRLAGLDSTDEGREPVSESDEVYLNAGESSTRRTLVLIKGPLELLLLVVIPALLILLAVTITIVVLCVLCRRHGNGRGSGGDRAAGGSARSGGSNIYTYQSANASGDGRAFAGALGGPTGPVTRVGSKTSSANDVELHFDFGRGVPVIFAEELEQLAPLGPIPPPPFAAANNRTLQRNGARTAGGARSSRSHKQFDE